MLVGGGFTLHFKDWIAGRLNILDSRQSHSRQILRASVQVKVLATSSGVRLVVCSRTWAKVVLRICASSVASNMLEDSEALGSLAGRGVERRSSEHMI